MATRKTARKGSRSVRKDGPSQAAIDFFYENAGYSHGAGETKEQGRRRSALALAWADKIAQDRGWQFAWEEDQEEYQLGDDEVRPDEVLCLVLRDEEGSVLGSLGGIGFMNEGGLGKQRRDRRVYEAEVALEAAMEQGLIPK